MTFAATPQPEAEPRTMTARGTVNPPARCDCDTRTAYLIERFAAHLPILRVIVLIFVIAIALLVLQPAASHGEDEDLASTGDWIYLTIVAVAGVILMVVIVTAWRRRANPYTGLPGRIRRARARRPLKKRAG